MEMGRGLRSSASKHLMQHVAEVLLIAAEKTTYALAAAPIVGGK
jgi:hypothetical protein